MATTISASSAFSATESAQTVHGTTVWSGFEEYGHQLEKLEFALAIAETRGDQERCSTLRAQIDHLGGNAEEPGT